MLLLFKKNLIKIIGDVIVGDAYMRHLRYWIILLLLSTLPLSALDTIDINTCNPNCVIGKNLEILEDKTNLLMIEDIHGMETEQTGCYDMMRKDAINRVSTTTAGNTITNPCWKKANQTNQTLDYLHLLTG